MWKIFNMIWEMYIRNRMSKLTLNRMPIIKSKINNKSFTDTDTDK